MKAVCTTGAVTGLAGCKDRQPTDSRQSDASEPIDATGERTGGERFAGDEFEGDRIKIGVLAPVPDRSPEGRSFKYGAKLAAELLNQAGGVLGAEVEILVGNTGEGPGKARSEYLRLVNKEDCEFTCGLMLNAVVQMLMPQIARHQTVHMTTGAIGTKPPRLLRDNYEKYKYHFSNMINVVDLSDAQLEFLNLYADQLGWESMGVLVENIGEFDRYAELMERKGSDVLDMPIIKRTSSGTSNWTPIYDELEDEGVDVAIVAQALTGTSAVVQWHNQKRDFEFGGMQVSSAVGTFWEEVDGKTEYVFTMMAATPHTDNTSRTQPFMKAYYERFGEYPIYTGPLTFDAVNMYATAVAETKSRNPEDVIRYLEETTYSNSTVVSEVAFNGPNASYPHELEWTTMKETGVPVWMQWQEVDGEGRMVTFAPEQNKTGAYEKPPWVTR